MNPSLPPDWLNSFLDDELSSEDRAAAELRLAESSHAQEELTSLRELDQLLRQQLMPPGFFESRFLAELDERRELARPVAGSLPSPGNNFAPTRPGPARSVPKITAVIIAVTTAVCLLATIGSGRFLSPDSDHIPSAATDRPIATVVRFVGHIEAMHPSESDWRRLNPGAVSRVTAGTKLRTRPMSLCEVETTASGLLRLNENTELIVRNPAEVELVSGEFWCRSTGDECLTVVVPGEAGTTKSGPGSATLMSFLCPTDSPTQWSCSGRDTRCLSLAERVAELTPRSSSLASCSVEPGQWITIGENDPSRTSGYADRVSASSWQLPLLCVGRPDHPELQTLLQSMLANLGHTKIASLYNSQIRSLGPTGTIPLIAFVRSSKSRETPDQRHKAMEIIADLAPGSARPDLEVLSHDRDPVVSRLAMTALTRIARASQG